jgi:hypothetical protein
MEECDATFYDSAVRKFGIEKVFQLIFCGIPCDARRVVKFNPLNKSLTELGPGLGEGVPIQRNIVDTTESF